MPQMTIQSFTVMKDKEGNIKKDKFGNTQMMIKFQESPETAYKAVKDPSSITAGKVMYGRVEEGQYGFRFIADPNPNFASPQPQQQAIGNIANKGELAEIKTIVLALYKAVTGEEYTEVKRETTSSETPAEEPENIDLSEIKF